MLVTLWHRCEGCAAVMYNIVEVHKKSVWLCSLMFLTYCDTFVPNISACEAVYACRRYNQAP